jgi:hypothetical protein
MTAEIPRYRPTGFATGSHPQVARPPASPQTESERAAAAAAAAHEVAAAQAAEAQATAAAQIAAAQAAARQRDNDGRYVDETMELPIFRELESAWFTTAKPAPTPAAASAPAASAPAAAPVQDDDPVTTQRFSTGEPARSSVPQQAISPESLDGGAPSLDGAQSRERDTASVGAAAANGNSNGNGNGNNPWHTAADEGWQAARAASELPIDTTTTAGLPKRTPMAQLVPGGVDRGANSTQRRTPEAVRGLLSAYHRGVQRGRQSTNPDDNPGGQQSSQTGKEHEA